MRLIKWTMMVLAGIWILGCQATAKHPVTKATEGNGKASSHNIPPLIEHQGLLPVPQILPKTETYTISVHQVPLKELLFSLARDAGINADIHPDVGGLMTLNATNQTLIQILDRIAQQIPLRYEIGHNNLLISPDVPYFYTYHIDYVNVSRGTKSEITVATEIATTGGSVAQGASGGEKNSSKTKIESEIYNDFWGILVNNIQRIISDNITAATGDKKSPMGSANVIVNPISGLINVKATQKQHLQVRQFIDKAVGSALKQVLIEATILEIELNNSFQTGVDWQRLSRNNGQGGNGPSLTAGVIDPSLLSPPMYLLQYNNVTSDLGNISAMIALLEQFGQVRVLSSPKLMTLNNQPAILKVVDEKVYFTVQRQITEATPTSAARETFTSEIHTVPVGVIMTVTPQVNENESVSLNIRPTITRITGFAIDPAPRLARVQFDNLIPEIQIREMESLLKVMSGETVVMGGLMQDKLDDSQSSLPWISRIPILGSLFKYKKKTVIKTELVIFLRPKLILNASLNGDFIEYRRYLNSNQSPPPGKQP